MGFAATLDDLGFPELLHLISLNRKSGRLSLTCREAHAVIVFRQGRVTYAASSRLKESFGYILMRNGVVTEQDLVEALERQDWLEHDRRLGNVLVQMGRVSADEARKALWQQAQWVITEVFQWRSGFFRFEPLVEPATGALLTLDDVLPRDGFDTEELLLESVTLMDEAFEERNRDSRDAREPPPPPGAHSDSFRVPPEWEPPRRQSSFASLLNDIHSPSFSGEIALTVMRYAGQIVSRGVFFLVSTSELLSIGQFGIKPTDGGPGRLRIPLTEPSVLREPVQTKCLHQGPLARLFWNDHLIEQLGGGLPQEAIVVPMVLEGRAAFVFYGDNPPGASPIGPIQGLEFLMAEAALAMERLLRGPAADLHPPRPPSRRNH
jgi:Domain of unknown function (DUF4388)